MSSTLGATSIRRPYRRHSAWAVVLYLLIFGIAIRALVSPIDGGAIAVLAFGPLYIQLDRRLFSPLLIGPCTLVFAYHALGYGIGPWWQVHMDGVTLSPGFAASQRGAAIGLATFALLFPAFFHLVYRRPPNETKALSKGRDAHEERWHSFGFVLVLVSVANLSYGFLSGAHDRLGGHDVSVGTDTASAAFQLAHQVVFFFLAYSAARRGGKALITWLVSISIYSAFFFLNGGRGTVVYALVFSACGFAWGGTSKRRIAIIGVALGILFVPLSGDVRVYRDLYGGLRNAPGLASRLSVFSDTLHGRNGNGVSMKQSAKLLAERVTAVNGDLVFQQTPNGIPYAGFAGFSRIPTAFVPRILSPSRTPLPDGASLAIQYGGAPPGSTGVYMTAVGDGYRRFGWVGVPLPYACSAMVFGVAMGACWRKRERREYMTTFLVLMILCADVWIYTILSLAWQALWSIPKYFVFFVVLRFLHDRWREFRRAPASA